MRHWLLAIPLAIAFVVATAVAAPIKFETSTSANLIRPCSHTLILSEELDSTAAGESASTAVTTGAAFMVTCLNRAWLKQGAQGVTGVVGAVPIMSGVPYWLLSETGGQYVGVIKMTGETDNKCYVTECR